VNIAQTAAELAASVTPTSPQYAPYTNLRYMTTAQITDVLAGTLTQDVTTPLQTWLTLCGGANVLAKGYGLCKITGALTYSGQAGIDWDCIGYDATTINGGLVVTGTGYIALTVSGQPTKINIAIAGTGNAADGLFLNNPVLVKTFNARIMNLAGFGLRIDQCFDCAFGTYSIQACGAAGKPAFSVNDGAGTSNESWFGRGQVELTNANAQAVFVSGNSVNCTFETLHSERASATSVLTIWSLGGRCTYKNVRLNASGTSANCKAFLNGINAQYLGLIAEGNIPVVVDCSGGTSQLLGCTIQGTYTENAAQTGNVSFYGGSIAAYAGGAQLTNTRLFDCPVAGVIQGSAVTYVPTWTASGTAPAIGNGTLTGLYWFSGTDNKLVNVRIRWLAGSTTTFGTGTYAFALPFLSANNGIFSGLGTVFINNAGVQTEGGQARVQPNATTVDMWCPAGAVPAMTQLGATVPHTFKNLDQIDITVQYMIP